MHSKTTTYKGINFRSVLESRWAYFFDLLNVEWQYEPEKVDLGGGLRYVPDFWLCELQAWVEIKGDIVNDAAGHEMIAKATRLAIASRHPVILTFRAPLDMRCALFSTRGKMFAGAHFTACPSCGRFAIAVRSGEKIHRLCAYNHVHSLHPIPFEDDRQFRRAFYNAAQAATKL